MDHILLINYVNRQQIKASFKIMDVIQVAQEVLVLMIYFLFVKGKYFFTVLSKVYNGGFENLCSVWMQIVSSTYISFVIGQQTARKKKILKSNILKMTARTNHTCKMENKNECWEIACYSLRYQSSQDLIFLI